MFLDYLYSLPTNTTGIDDLLIETINIVPNFVPLILFFVFAVVFIGGISRQQLKTGTADYPAWAILSSIATLLVALLFSVHAGYIRLDWLGIVIAMNIISAIWFFLDRKVTEV